MKYFIIHGAYGSPNENWFPWLKKELEKQGHSVFVPKLPTPEGQTLKNWKKEFEKYKKEINEDTVFIGHSMGPAFILTILEELELAKPVKACFFISGFIALLGNKEFDKINKTFMEHNFEWKKIKQNCSNFYLINAQDDPYVPWKLGKELSEKLDGEFILKEKGGHFNTEAGYTEFEYLLKLIRYKLIKTKQMTLCFAQKNYKILLAMKKRGFGAGRWNGYGGKVQDEETVEEAAKREIQEESEIENIELEQKGIIEFDLPKEEKMLEVHVYEITNYEGTPKETEEMKPKWFNINEIPYDEMWPDDKHWLPLFIEGKKIKAKFKFDENDKVIEKQIKEIEEL
ncbi:alpha/beta hydrolase [Candidatus Woesearchaeota archaeon]|nr:alpha/beta hydrolase [Candidatus Woesearchaeota archaeon]